MVIHDECVSRNTWKLGRMVEVYASQNSLILSVKVSVGNSNITKRSKLLAQPSEVINLNVGNETRIGTKMCIMYSVLLYYEEYCQMMYFLSNVLTKYVEMCLCLM